MDLRIRIPPAELFDAIDDMLCAINTYHDNSIQRYLINICNEFPGFLDNAYKRKQYILNKAVECNNEIAVKTLLQYCFAEKWINVPDADKRTPMLWSIVKRNIEISHILIKYGANITSFETLLRLLYMNLESDLY